MLRGLQVRGRSENTQKAYIHQIKNFAEYFGVSPERLGLEEVYAYQAHLIEHKKASKAQLSQFAAAARFLYEVTLERDWQMRAIAYPKMPRRLPEVISEA
jgi:site-specific recombinase XerD